MLFFPGGSWSKQRISINNDSSSGVQKDYKKNTSRNIKTSRARYNRLNLVDTIFNLFNHLEQTRYEIGVCLWETKQKHSGKMNWWKTFGEKFKLFSFWNRVWIICFNLCRKNITSILKSGLNYHRRSGPLDIVLVANS